MTQMQEKERRSSIQAIMSDKSLTPLEKRRSIQSLMDGRRSSAGFSTCAPCTEMSPATATAKRMEESRPPCNHYERNCSIISPCCGATFGCRLCHDECPVLPPPKYGVGAKKNKQKYHRSSSLPSNFTDMSEPEHHTIDRFAIREIICRKCFTRQTSKRNECINCYAQFGEYHCRTCNLWMSSKEKPYHCDACGFCRIGGRENFRHCYSCGMCVDVHLYHNHNCNAGKFMSRCPVCQDDLFTSRHATHEMPCGHTIHWHCFQDLVAYDSRCPVCKKTTESAESMATAWKSIAHSIEMQPLPPEMAKVVNITCNDCDVSSVGRSWHFLGVQCSNCNSFNTSVDEIVMKGLEAAQFLGEVTDSMEY